MVTRIDDNAYSALFSDSEESESSELSALLANPDLDIQKPLSIRELQESSETGGEKRSRIEQPQQTVVDYETEEEKSDYNEEGLSPNDQSPLEASGEQGFKKVEPIATVPPLGLINNPASQVSKIDQSQVQARDQVRTGLAAVPHPPVGQRPLVSSSASFRGNGTVAEGKTNGNVADLEAVSRQRDLSADLKLPGFQSGVQTKPKHPVRQAPAVPSFHGQTGLTGRVSPFNVRDIIPYISVEAYEQEKSRAIQVDSDEEEEEKEEFKEDPDFDPKVGDFLLFPNFGDVPYHLVRVTGRPFDDAVAFSYFGVSKQNKKRLVGFQQVWNHDDASKPEIQQNAPVKMNGYKIVDHEVLLSEFCQKVIVPVEYGPPTNRKFKLKYSDVQEVLKYRPDT